MKKLITLILMAMLTVALADDRNLQFDLPTICFAFRADIKTDNPTLYGKIMQGLGYVVYRTWNPSEAQIENIEDSYIKTDVYVASANTNVAVAWFEMTNLKAGIVPYEDIEMMRDKADNNAAVAIDLIRQSEREQWRTDNGVSKKAVEVTP